MNHRKLEHPSKKICRYFLKETCDFQSEECWYRHVKKSDANSNESTEEHDCNKCEIIFTQKSDLMKHLKKEHPTTVPKCRNYMQGKCHLTEELCWFAHPIIVVDEIHKNNVADKKAEDDSVFHEAQEKTPPDQMSYLIEIVTKLALKVKNIERMTQKTN